MDPNNIDKLFGSQLNIERSFSGKELVWSKLESQLQKKKRYFFLIFLTIGILTYFFVSLVGSQSNANILDGSEEELFNTIVEKPQNSGLAKVTNTDTLHDKSTPRSSNIIQSKKKGVYLIDKSEFNAPTYSTKTPSSTVIEKSNTQSAYQDFVSSEPNEPTENNHNGLINLIKNNHLSSIDALPTLDFKLNFIEKQDLRLLKQSDKMISTPSSVDDHLKASIGVGANQRSIFSDNIELISPTNLYGELVLSFNRNWSLQLRFEQLNSQSILKSYKEKYNFEIPYSPFPLEDIDTISIEQKRLRFSAHMQHSVYQKSRFKLMLNMGIHLGNSSETNITYKWQTVYGQQEIIEVRQKESIQIDNFSLGTLGIYSIHQSIDIAGSVNYHIPIKNRLNNWEKELNLSLGLRMYLN
jgi:hypothetical protein